MLEVGSVTPYGLNDNVKGYGNMATQKPRTNSVNQMFNSQHRRSHSHGHRKYNNHLIHSNISVSYIKNICNTNNYLHQLRTVLYSLPLKLLHELSVEIEHASKNGNIQTSIGKICHDIATFRLYRMVQINDTRQIRLCLKLKCLDKGIGMINMPRIFNEPDVVHTKLL